MPKVDLDEFTQQETIDLIKDAMTTLRFDDVWNILMEVWDGDDKEEALARLNDECADDNEDC